MFDVRADNAVVKATHFQKAVLVYIRKVKHS